MNFKDRINSAFILTEAISPSVIAMIDVISSSEFETNVIIYGLDRSGLTTSPRKAVGPDVLNLGISGAESFPDIKDPDNTTTWYRLTEWLLKLLSSIGLDPMINPDADKVINKMLQQQLKPGAKLALVPIGNQGMEIRITGEYFNNMKQERANEQKRFMKSGLQYVLDIVLSPSLGETKEDAAADLYKILKTNKQDWFNVRGDYERRIYISTSYEESGYPKKVYVGPDDESVVELEDWINRNLMKVKGYDPNNAPEPLRSELLDKIAKLKAIYDEGENKEWEYSEVDDQGIETKYKHQYVIDPTTEAGQNAVRHRAAQSLGTAKSERSRKAAETVSRSLGDRYKAQFTEAVARIVDEGLQYGVPQDMIVRGIISMLRRYDINISSLDDFENLDIKLKNKAADRLKNSEYIDVHGIWESVTPKNEHEENIIRLCEYNKKISDLKSFLIENPGVYAQVLKLNGFNNSSIVTIMEHYSLSSVSTTDEDKRVASIIIEANSIVDNARRLFSIMAASMDSDTAVYAEKFMPSSLIGEDGYIANSSFAESSKQAGVNILDVYARQNGKIDPLFLVRLP